ncbi:MAG: glycosyltransferase [bacterium]|nr:glycosyltransferase [bacterium]
MRLHLIFHGRFPSDKAASLFAAKSAEAFADRGMPVTLIVPRLLGREAGDPYLYYGVKKNFTISCLSVLDMGTSEVFRRLRFSVSFLTFSVTVFLHLLFKARKDDLVYSNEWLPLLFASFRFRRTVYEMHDFPESNLAFFGWFMRRMRRVVIHNRWKMLQSGKRFSVRDDALCYEPNAVDIGKFRIAATGQSARSTLNLPAGKKIVVYTGHLYRWKGVDVLAAAAEKLSDEYLVAFVGGTAEETGAFREKYGCRANILIAGFRPHDEIPLWQKAADVLVLPNTAKENISAYYTSPMKLFEYAASGRPIVASDIPSIRELLSENTAFLVAPDNPKALALGIRRACEDKDRNERAKRAFAWVKNHTWGKRAGRILEFALK